MHKSLAKMSEKQMKKVFPLARNSLSTNPNAFRNTFPLDGKIKLAVAGVCLKMEGKNGFHQPENQFPPAGIRLFFKNWISRFPKTEQKSLDKRILFQLDRKSVSSSRNGEFVYEYVSIRQKNCLIDRNTQKIKGNGCHQQ